MINHIKDHQPPLDFPITNEELIRKLGDMQPRKACGVDGILNEMLKYTDSKFQCVILMLFNLILKLGFFPDIWNDKDTFKNGDKDDPSNYRGIHLSSNLGKLLCSVLNSRISSPFTP